MSRQKISADTPSIFSLYTSLGRTSHRFAEWLYTHHVRLAEPRQLSWFEEDAKQATLFGPETVESEHPGLFNGSTPEPLPSENRRRFDQRFLRESAELLRAFHPVLESPNVYDAGYFSLANKIGGLQDMMRRTFPEQYALLGAACPNLNILPVLATQTAWLGLLKRRLYQDRSVTSLTEVPVSPRNAEVLAGRIDRLDIIDGKTDILRNLRRQNVESASEFVEQVIRLHPSTRVRVVDYKFSVGDMGDKIIPSDAFKKKNSSCATSEPEERKRHELARMFAKHQSQVQWYVLWLALRHEMLNGRSGKELPDDNRFTGLIIYALPNGKLVDVPVEPAAEELQRRFVEQVVYHWQTIEGKRDTRIFNNAATNALRDRLVNGGNGNGNGDKDRRKENGDSNHAPAPKIDAKPDPIQIPLISEGLENHPVRDLVDSFRNFTGTANVIEEISGGEKVRYRMHLGRLARAIQNGEITVGQRFSWERGGHICCLLHKEKTPSMHLAFEQGLFYCFGCHATGIFAREDLPLDLLTIVPSEHIAARRVGSHGLPEISEETTKIMATAQEILSRNFPGSMAEHYLTKVRFLDEALVRSAGAGCAVRDGRDVLINELLGAGYSLDDLVAQGFLNYSERAKSWSPAVRTLRNHGLSDDQIIRRERKKSMGGTGTTEVISWPFSTLSGRATFPLSLPIGSQAVITGFYGRSAMAESKLPHFVLTPDDTPKGMFNGGEIAEQVADGGIDKVYLTEGIIDALVIQTVGYGPVVAIIGTHTSHLEQLIARLNPGEINIALDFDNAGITGTERLRSSFVKYRYTGTVNDFAGDFAANHPEIAKNNYDDFGTWWEKFGRHQQQQKR